MAPERFRSSSLSILAAAVFATVLAALPFVGSPQGLVRPGRTARNPGSPNLVWLRIHSKSGEIQNVYVRENSDVDTEDRPSVSWPKGQFTSVVTSKGADGSWTIDATLPDARAPMDEPTLQGWRVGIFFEL
jgi:hypothetical protein